jgi:hypothetical protein
MFLLQWRHVPTEQNPADLISRGVMPEVLKTCQEWFHGPQFLSSPEASWSNPIITVPSQEVPELKVISFATCSVEDSFVQDYFRRYSSFKKLVNVTAYCLRFCKNVQAKKQGITCELGCLTSQERTNSLQVLVRLVQSEEFKHEIAQLNSNSKKISGKNRLLNLNPFIKDGILRVGGRLENSNLSFEEKNSNYSTRQSYFHQTSFRTCACP